MAQARITGDRARRGQPGWEESGPRPPFRTRPSRPCSIPSSPSLFVLLQVFSQNGCSWPSLHGLPTPQEPFSATCQVLSPLPSTRDSVWSWVALSSSPPDLHEPFRCQRGPVHPHSTQPPKALVELMPMLRGGCGRQQRTGFREHLPGRAAVPGHQGCCLLPAHPTHLHELPLKHIPNRLGLQWGQCYIRSGRGRAWAEEGLGGEAVPCSSWLRVEVAEGEERAGGFPGGPRPLIPGSPEGAPGAAADGVTLREERTEARQSSRGHHQPGLAPSQASGGQPETRELQSPRLPRGSTAPR